MLEPLGPRGRDDRVDPFLDRARARVLELFFAALDAVDPSRAVVSSLSLRNDSLVICDAEVPAPMGVHVVSVGKGAVAMTRGALQVLEGAVVSGDVITKQGHADGALPDRIRVFEAGHPIPDERGVEATEMAVSALRELDSGIVVLALISGGGSALLEAPRDGLTLTDLAKTTDVLLRAGAPIDALNSVRAPLSKVKAGGLRDAAPRARWITLILSDVLGNDPRIIASGPTVPAGRPSGLVDPESPLEIIARFGVKDHIPSAVAHALEGTPRPFEVQQTGEDILRVIADNALAVDAAANKARELGLESLVAWSAAQGEAADLGRTFASIVAGVPQTTNVVLGGGEATVTVRGGGKGGRNTEFSLAAAIELERRSMPDWVIASLGTDGQDALTGLAGAIADAGTCARARASGIDPLEALAANDSASLFEVAGGAVATGPTGTNVNDLYVAVRLASTTESGTWGGD